MVEQDIPNYIAIPISIAAGFLIAYISRKYWPTVTEEQLVENQSYLLSRCLGPIINAMNMINDSLKIHENYEDQRNFQFQLHEEDKKRIESNYDSFIHQKRVLEKINSNSIGEVFYGSLMKYLENGQFLITQGYVEPKFFYRACEGLKVVKDFMSQFEGEYIKFEIISFGDTINLDDF